MAEKMKLKPPKQQSKPQPAQTSQKPEPKPEPPKTANQPESRPPSDNPGNGSPELDHLKSLNFNGLKTATAAPGQGGGLTVLDGVAAMDPDVLSPDDFYQGVFVPLHAVSGAVFMLESLPVKPEEEQRARAASDALYDTALETPALRFLIEPSNKWMQRAFALWAYAAPKAAAVRMELMAKKAQPVNPKKEDIH